VNPYKVNESDQMMQFYKAQLKLTVGAQFIITQLGYNIRKLSELKHYLTREGLGDRPVLANVYVPTAKIAQMMQAGEVAGCVIPDELIRRLEKEKKPQRLERAALMVAAAKSLGFAGAHVGGFGLTHKDFMTIMERAAALSGEWRNKLDELIFPYPNEFYLLPQATDGLSDGTGDYQVTHTKPHATFVQWLSKQVHQHLIAEGSFGHRFFSARLKPNGDGAPGTSRPVVLAAGAFHALSQGHFGLQKLRRLSSGPPRLRRLLNALVLQRASQRPLRRFESRWNLRGAARAALHLERDLQGRLGRRRRSPEVRPHPHSTSRLVPGQHQCSGQSHGRVGQRLQEERSSGGGPGSEGIIGILSVLCGRGAWPRAPTE
jgi:hypothetical protein